MNQKWQIGLVIGALAIAVAVVAESVLRPRVDRSAPAAPPKAPEGALNPSAAAYRPKGAEWTKYARGRPLEVGDRAPALTLNDERGKKKIPTPQKPAIWAVLCGCNDCADAGYQTFEILKEMGKDQVDAVLFVSNTTDYVQERMGQSFKLRCRVVDDGNGDYYRALRPPGLKDYSRLPMVWAIDRNGKVVFFGRTKRGNSVWKLEIQEKLGLKRPLEPPIE